MDKKSSSKRSSFEVSADRLRTIYPSIKNNTATVMLLLHNLQIFIGDAAWLSFNPLTSRQVYLKAAKLYGSRKAMAKLFKEDKEFIKTVEACKVAINSYKELQILWYREAIDCLPFLFGKSQMSLASSVASLQEWEDALERVISLFWFYTEAAKFDEQIIQEERH